GGGMRSSAGCGPGRGYRGCGWHSRARAPDAHGYGALGRHRTQDPLRSLRNGVFGRGRLTSPSAILCFGQQYLATRLAIAKMSEASITMSERAARRIVEILRAEDAALMRVSVEGGGCSGFQYKFDLVKEGAPDDILIERDGARVVVDPVSAGFVQGAEIDFVDDLIGSNFKIKNPNVTAACGCGTSFSI